MHQRHNIRLDIAYDGTRYLGWQKTLTGPSIEGTLQKILEQVLQHSIQLQAASRTDAGVHAHGQVANFFTTRDDLKKLFESVNGLLPKDIVVLNMEKVPNFFHPTLDCVGKEYHYHISLGPVYLPEHRFTAWHFHQPLDMGKMEVAKRLLIGKHDFAAFCNVKKNESYESTIREIEDIIIDSSQENFLTIKVLGKKFLYKMVRNIIGTLIWSASGKIDPRSIENILNNRDRTLAGVTAPAHGLTLFKVEYPYGLHCSDANRHLA